MRNIKTLLFVLLFAMAMPLSQAADRDTTIVYTQEQVDKIVAEEVQKVVKAEVARQVDTELIDLKVDKAAKESLGAYISEQNKSQAIHDAVISHHLTIIGFVIAILAAIIGVFVPLFINYKAEERYKEIKVEIEKAKDSARQAKYSLLEFQARSEKDFKKQIRLAEQLLKDSQSSEEEANAYYVKGTILGSKSFYNEAINDLQNSIRLKESINKDAENSYAYYNLGDYYLELNKYDEAATNYNKAIERNGNHAFSYKRLADCILKQTNAKKEDFLEALACAEKAIRINENECKLYLTRCDVYLKLDKFEEAMEDINKGKDIAKKQEKYYLIEEFEKKKNEIEDKRRR